MLSAAGKELLKVVAIYMAGVGLVAGLLYVLQV
jgi:hypothetical protein